MSAPAAPSFVELFLPLQGDLVAYLLAQGVKRQDVDDCLQNLAGLLFARFSDFRAGTNFRAWTFTFAVNQVHEYRRQRGRRMPELSPEAAEQITRLSEEPAEGEPVRVRAIRVCVEKLQSHAREMVTMRYQRGMTVESMARTLRRPVGSLYTTLFRIRRALMDCAARFERAEEPA